MRKNLPVPAHARAPFGLRWLWWIGPPAAITAAYRAIPPRTRSRWNLGGATSHLGLAAILAGGGWRAFWHYAIPRPGVGDSWQDISLPGPSLGWADDYGRGSSLSGPQALRKHGYPSSKPKGWKR